jgi:hypothetical protein
MGGSFQWNTQKEGKSGLIKAASVQGSGFVRPFFLFYSDKGENYA